MSLMAGFDIILEISQETLEKIIKSRLSIGGISANPPFEFTVTFSSQGYSGSLHVIVTELSLELNADDTMTITLKFNNTSGTSLTIDPPFEKVISVLEGDFKISSISPVLEQTGPNLRELSFNVDQSDVKLNLTVNSTNKIKSAISGSGLSYANITNSVSSSLKQSIHLLNWRTGLVFMFSNPGANGSLTGPVFSSLVPHCIEPSALGLFGMVFANKPGGNHVQKSTTAITQGNDVSMSISPEVFRSFIFCPALVPALGVNSVSELPGGCGSSGSVDVQDVTITGIHDSFTQGHVNIDGSFEDSGFCYEASGTFHGEITFTISSCTTLVPNLVMSDPEVDVDIDWYCGPAGIAYEFLGLTANIITTTVFEGVAESFAKDASNAMMGKALPGQSISPLAGVCFNQISITPEGLSLIGTVNVSIPNPGNKGLILTGSVNTTNKVVASTGIYNSPPMFFCVGKEFPYTEYLQHQTATYYVAPVLLGKPLKLRWYIESKNVKTMLNDSDIPTSGSVPIPSNKQYPFPLVAGTTITNQQVQINYSILPDNMLINIMNKPEDGNYSIWLEAKVQDSLGTIVKSGTWVDFEGNIVEIGGGYKEWKTGCYSKYRQWLDKEGTAFDKFVEPWVPIDLPPPEKLLEFIISVIKSESPKSKEIIADIKAAHGNSFLKALRYLKERNMPKPESGLETDQK